MKRLKIRGITGMPLFIVRFHGRLDGKRNVVAFKDGKWEGHYHEILKYMDRVRSTRGGDSTDFVKFRPRRWVSNPFASSILLTVDRSGLRIHAS